MPPHDNSLSKTKQEQRVSGHVKTAKSYCDFFSHLRISLCWTMSIYHTSDLQLLVPEGRFFSLMEQQLLNVGLRQGLD